MNATTPYQRCMAEQRVAREQETELRRLPAVTLAMFQRTAATIDLFHFGAPSVPQRVGGWR